MEARIRSSSQWVRQAKTSATSSPSLSTSGSLAMSSQVIRIREVFDAHAMLTASLSSRHGPPPHGQGASHHDQRKEE
jgi:hypothetical protein